MSAAAVHIYNTFSSILCCAAAPVACGSGRTHVDEARTSTEPPSQLVIPHLGTSANCMVLQSMFVRSGPHAMFQAKDKQKLIAQKQGTAHSWQGKGTVLIRARLAVSAEELKKKETERDKARARLEDLQRQLREVRSRQAAVGLRQ